MEISYYKIKVFTCHGSSFSLLQIIHPPKSEEISWIPLTVYSLLMIASPQPAISSPRHTKYLETERKSLFYVSLRREDLSFLCPRMREIWRPLLKAWLKSILVWNSETKGNQARIAMGVKRSRPIMISNPRATACTKPQMPAFCTKGFKAWDICITKKSTI